MARQHQRRRGLWAACVLFALGLCPRPASAWTRASVEAAQAHLDVEASGRVLVSLALSIRVAGGWLSSFEIAGLDPDLVLDPDKPPWFSCEDGRKVVPRAKVGSDGRIVVSFPNKQEAPHRGLHRLALLYTSTLTRSTTPSPDKTEVSWSLPAWQVDLGRSDIWVDAPEGASFGTSTDADASVTRERFDRGSRTILHYARAHLPRTVAFSAQFELAKGPAALALRSAHAATQQARSHAASWVAALVLACVWLKRRAVLATCARQGARPAPVFDLDPLLRWALSLGLGAASASYYQARPGFALALLASIVMLGCDRSLALATDAQPHGTSTSGREKTAHSRAYALLGPASWIDATTPLGLGLLGSSYALSMLRLALGTGPDIWLEALILVTPLWLTGTRLHVPRSMASSPPRPGEAQVESDDISLAWLSAAADRPERDRAA